MNRFLAALIATITLQILGSPVKAAPSSDNRFGRFAGFVLGETTLSDVQAKVGTTQMVHSGDAGDSLYSLCYAVNSSGYALFLAGELDGPEHYLGGFDLSDKPTRLPCTPWSKDTPKPSLSIGGLYIGMSASAFMTTVGVPVKWEANRAVAVFESRKDMSAAELAKLPPETQARIARGESQNYYDEVITVSAIFESGKLREVRVWKTETL